MPGFDTSVGCACCLMYSVCKCAAWPKVGRVEVPAEYWLSSVSQDPPSHFSLLDRNSVPLHSQKFNNAAVIMYLFALFPWAHWLLASLNIGQDNLWISIRLFLSVFIQSWHSLPSLIHFTFWFCTSSSAMCSVKMTTGVSSHFPVAFNDERSTHICTDSYLPWLSLWVQYVLR